MNEKKTFKEKMDETKGAAEEKWFNLKEWCKRNKELIVVFGPVVIGSGIEVLKVITKRHNINEEKRLKDNYIYDRSAGHYYEMRRKPKNSEWKMIDERRQHGESLGSILSDMRLMK